MFVKKPLVLLLIALLAMLPALVWPGGNARVYASDPKITLTPAMVTNESGKGDATLLVDEQSAAGDPANGSGGSPTTSWVALWNMADYPASAYIDLGQSYNITGIYMWDTYDIGNLTVSAGSPGSWTSLFTYNTNNWMVWNAHTASVQTRYIRVTLADYHAQISEIVLYGTPVTGGDTTAPAAIANLSAPSSTSSSVTLNWTAPGDDGSTGTASSYDIRYSTSTITSGNWGSATQASGEPAPAAAGTGQSMTVSGLSASTTYYFAMKTKDEVPNESGLSNVVSKATAAASSIIKIPLDPSMVLNETATGNPEKLVDEQTLSGDPLHGSGGTPTTNYYPGGGFANSMVNSAIINLGQDYEIDNIFLYDPPYGPNGSYVKVYTGSPFQWTQQVSDPMTNTPGWINHPVSVPSTHYLKVEISDGGVQTNELVVYGRALGTNIDTVPSPSPHTLPTMDKLIGINGFNDDSTTKQQVAGNVREYHNWGWDEGDWAVPYAYPYPNNRNKFSPSYGASGGFDFDAYYHTMSAAGVSVVPTLIGGVNWLTANFADKPVPSGADPKLPASYAAHADHMFQYAARYGSTAVADNKLKLAPDQARSTGLGYIQYYEDWNEGDAKWSNRTTYFTPYEYAAMASADYDGDQGRMGNTFGIKNADPNGKMAMMGLAYPNVDYIRAMKVWSDYYRSGSFPADAINIHSYNFGPSNAGISPEAAGMKTQLEAFADYRNRYLPGKEFWLSEFGYDVNQSSPIHAPSIGTFSVNEVQAQWIVRSYLAAAAAGVDKAQMYMFRDVDVNSATQFDSSGLVSSKATGEVPRTSYYYVYTLKNTLAGMRYVGEQGSGNANVKIYKFKSATGSNGAYVVWAPTSNQTTVSGYQLSLTGSPTTASLVTMADGDTDGVSSAMTIAGGKVSVNVSERPVFVLTNDMQ